MSEPSTQIYLYQNCMFDDTYENCINFSSGSRSEYLASKLARYFQNAMFVRKDDVYRLNMSFGSMRDINYMRYNNNDGGGDYYAFITSKKYVSVDVTEITIKTDVFQTYLNNFQIKDSFIVREHSTTDIIGENTIPEPVSSNQTIINDSIGVLNPPIGLKNILIVFSGKVPNDNNSQPQINNMPTASRYYIVDENNLDYFVFNINAIGQTDSILSISYLPSIGNLILSDNIVFGDTLNATCKLVIGGGVVRNTFTINRDNNIDGYTPKNNKMFTYPYNYIQVTDSESDINLKYERFHNNDFKVVSEIVLDNNVNAVISPVNYEYKPSFGEIQNNYQYSLNYNKFPLIPYNYSVYKEYLAQNKNSLSLSFISDGLNIGTDIATSNYMGVVSGAMSAANKIASLADMRNKPLRQRQQNSDMTHYALNINVKINKISVVSEHAKVIDDYFTKYGYATNEIKTPNLNSRPYFNYIETENANILGIPFEDLNEFKSIFNSGVTIWHSTDNYLNYGVDNGV